MVVTSPRRGTRRVPRKWRFIGGGIALAIFVVAFIVWRWSTPAKSMRAFVAAIERRDAEAVYALILPQQRQAMNLTPDKVRTVLEQTIWRFGTVKAVVVEEAPRFEHQSDKAMWVVMWGDAATGGRLPVSWPTGLITPIGLRPTHSGWRVNFNDFLVVACGNIWGVEQGDKFYSRICRQAGVHPIPLGQ